MVKSALICIVLFAMYFFAKVQSFIFWNIAKWIVLPSLVYLAYRLFWKKKSI
jgi:hypothetical protein